MGDNKQAIIQTLLYSSIFKFPLTEEEIHYYLHTSKHVKKEVLHKSLQQLVNDKLIIVKANMYALAREDQSFKSRDKRHASTTKKYHLAQKLAARISLIPSVLFVGISGSLAVGNATEDDDIDFFIITSKNTLFTTRLFALLLLQLAGRRRKRHEIHPKDKACLNMLIAEDSLSMPNTNHDLYTAHEIAQLHPLINKGNIYERFLHENNWIATFLANSIEGKKGYQQKREHSQIVKLLTKCEGFMRFFQLRMMKPHLTREKVTRSLLALHPSNTRLRILEEYQQKLLYYNKYYKR